MKIINEISNFFKQITQEQLIDIGIALIIILIFCIFNKMFAYLIIKMFKFKEKDKMNIKNSPFYKPLRALFICVGIYLGISVINIPLNTMKIFRKILNIAIIGIISNGLVNFVDSKNGIVKKLKNDEKPDGNKTVANFTSKILKYVIYIGAGLLILAEFGINLSSLIAGLGVGSAVVALAAQDFVKSLISGISILSDRPFLVGDWIKVGTDEGEVIEISFRCTKIKTSDNTIVTIQNSTFTTNNVINWSRMKQRRYLLNIKLPLETNSDKIEKIINRIKFVLNNTENVDKNSIQVHFNTIEQDGININIYMYTDIVVYVDYLAFREKVNNQILKVMESENIKIAYPSHNIYICNLEDEGNTTKN